MYFNTTHETGQQGLAFRLQANRQDEKVMQVFHSTNGPLSPSVAHEFGRRWYKWTWPLTSTRRSITTLTNAGRLCKTDHKMRGPYGRPEYLWQLSQTKGG